jgi:cytochrome c oxidase subunit 2
MLKTPRDQIENRVAKNPDYLLEVDNEVVVPVGKKVRLIVTGADVIHAWWIPALGAKQDAIPGFLRDIWFRVDKDKPGVYRGQCVELCGKEHGFMPIVVRAVSSEDYTKWVGEQKKKMAVAEADSTKEWTEAELVARGEKVFSSVCAACHQGNGQGIPNTFPPLVGSKVVNGPKTAQIDTVLHGRKGVYRPNTQMPPQDSLSDVDIASAITFTRHSWGNKPKENVVQPTEVKAQRAKK